MTASGQGFFSGEVRVRWRLPAGPGWRELFGPVEALVRDALTRLELVPARSVDFGVGEGPAWVVLDAGGPRLCAGLLAGGMRAEADEAWALAAGEDLAPLAPDRWRRAAGALLEGLALVALAERWPDGEPMAWWRVARAVEAVDRAAPQLGGLWMEAVDLRSAAEQSLVASPRRAAWLARWLHGRGAPTSEEDDPPRLCDADIAAFGAWVRDAHVGPSTLAPLPLPLTQADGPELWEASPWSLRAVSRRSGPAGLALGVEGAAVVGPAAVADGQELAAVLGSAAGGPVALSWRPGGPLGSWELATGNVGDRLGAARGVVLELKADGRLEIRLADAFMGLPTAPMLELAETVGVSGWASGRWRVIEGGAGTSAGELKIESVTPRGLTLHPRGGHAFAVPAASVIGPAERILVGLAGSRLRWSLHGEALTLTGPISGLPVELRFRVER